MPYWAICEVCFKPIQDDYHSVQGKTYCREHLKHGLEIAVLEKFAQGQVGN